MEGSPAWLASAVYGIHENTFTKYAFTSSLVISSSPIKGGGALTVGVKSTSYSSKKGATARPTRCNAQVAATKSADEARDASLERRKLIRSNSLSTG